MPERPAPAPVPLPPPDEPVLGSEAESIIADEDDDQTIAAAPDASAFAPRVHGSKPVHTAIYANLFFRRTIIPILLTCGVMLPAIGIWSMIDRNAPLAAIGTGVEVLLIVVGAVLLALGVLNAFHVKHIMETSAARGMS